MVQPCWKSALFCITVAILMEILKRTGNSETGAEWMRDYQGLFFCAIMLIPQAAYDWLMEKTEAYWTKFKDAGVHLFCILRG